MATTNKGESKLHECIRFGAIDAIKPIKQNNKTILVSLSYKFGIEVSGMDHKNVTKEQYNCAPSLFVVAFCTIFQAGPVGTGLGVKFGRHLVQNRKQKCTF